MRTTSAVCLLWAAMVVSVSSQSLQEFAIGNQKLSADIYTRMLNEEKGNFLVCPISLEIIMALTQTGARGETAKQLAKGLNLPNNKEEVEALMGAVVPTLRGNSQYNLSTANKIFVKDNFEISEDFKTTAEKVFGSGIENVDFSKPPQASNTINKWVEQNTNNLIRDLIKPDDIDADTRLILVNALHFKGKWEAPFDSYGTYKRDFFVTPDKKVKVDMMSQTENFNYYENNELNAKFLELPYEGNDVVMTFVLPNEKTGLAALEGRIKDVFKPQPYKNERVNVQIPKFTMESTIQFKPIFEDMGVTLPFTDNADFSGIGANQEPLKISKIIQKTFINVTEEGTEAAAATAGGIVTLSIPAPVMPPKHNFTVDRPFLFAIKHKRAGNLFVGTVKKPKPIPEFTSAKRKNW